MRKLLLILSFVFVSWPALAAEDVRCVLIEEFSNKILTFRNFELACPPDPEGKPWHWIEAPKTQKPNFNAETHALSGPFHNIDENGAFIETWVVTAKTPEELDQERDARVEGLDVVILKRICDHESRIRVLENKSPITLDQCKEAIKNALD